MAFIRWKKNKFGIRQAYLIHSYRGEDGKPKHKTLAYLGRAGSVSPELIASLKEQHKDWNVKWEAIQPSSHPAPESDISGLSNWELAQQARQLRRERGIHFREMVKRLQEAGAPAIRTVSSPEPISFKLYRWLERGWQSSTHAGFQSAAEDLSPYLRKVLETQDGH